MSDYFFREVTPEDAEGMVAYMKVLAAEPHNMTSFSAEAEFTATVEEERALIRTYVESPIHYWLLAVAQEGQIVGAVSCAPVGLRGFRYTQVLGISLATAWRNRGIGTLMMQHAIDWCRANPLVYRLELNVFAHNARGIHIYEKLGFVKEGVRRKAFFKHGEFVDDVFMGMLFDRPTLPE